MTRLILGLGVAATVLPSIRIATTTGQSPHLGTPKRLVDGLWKPYIRGGRYCTPPEQGLSTCEYTAGSIHIAVGYTRGVANDFIAWHFGAPGGAAAWRFLVAILPAHAAQTACRTIKKTGGGYGPARACIYRVGKHHDMVAEYLAPTDPQTQGETVQDEGFDYITAAH